MKRFNIWIIALLFLSLCLTEVIFLWAWGLNRGFDVTDEAFYLVSYQNPNLYGFVSCFAFLSKLLPRLCPDDLINFRTWEFLARCVIPVILCLSVSRWLTVKHGLKISPIVIVCFCELSILGNLISFVLLPRVIGYNGMVTALLMLAFSMLIVGETFASSNLSLSRAFYVLSGFVLGLCFFVKVTSFACCSAAFIVLLVAFERRSALVKIVFVVIGIITAFLFYFIFLQSVSDFQANFVRQLFLATSHGHGAGLLGPLFHQVVHNALRFPVVLIAIFVLSAWLRWNQKNQQLVARLAPALTIGFGLLIVAFSTHSSQLFDKHTIYLPTIVSLCFLSAMLIVIPDLRKLPKSIFIVGIYLACSPMLMSFGTDQDLVHHARCNLVGFYVASGLCFYAIGKALGSELITVLLICTLSALSTVTFVDGYVYHPFGLGSDLFHQNEVSCLPRLSGILLDNHRKQFLDEAGTALLDHGYRSGDPILCLYQIPGLVYAMNGVSVAKAFFLRWQDSPHMFANVVPLSEYPRLFLTTVPPPFEQWDVLTPEMVTSLKESGLQFPTSFQQIGSVINPLWSRDRTMKLYVYYKKQH